MYLKRKIISLSVLGITLLPLIFNIMLLPKLTLGAEVNILSERQEFLFRPFLNEFEEKTGIKTNVVYLKKGSLERLKK